MVKIALTFNGGPQITHSPEGVELGTAELLRVIEEFNANLDDPIRVTLFFVGQHLQEIQANHPELLEQIKRSGHEIGNNSFSHPKNFHLLALEEVLVEVRQNHELIAQILGQPPIYFRPPNGLITTEAIQAIKAEFPDYEVVGWNRHDEKSNDTPATFRERTLQHAADQQVVLLHDWRKPTLWALRGMLTQLQQQGYQIVSLRDLEKPLTQQGLRASLPPRVDMPRIAFTFDDDPKVLAR
ncbi:MAG: polysaccharide deacetylase family protein, partial [Leptolyngbya sp. SIO1D8]|nr:polysaccharide deacetylase family protein [Leptolyngbya sp. SIO1D8]